MATCGSPAPWADADLLARVVSPCLHALFVPERPFKRTCIRPWPPSDLQPSLVGARGYIRPASDAISNEKTVFYAGRQDAAPLNTAPPALLVAPEFGLVYDAAQGDPRCAITPGPGMLKVWCQPACSHAWLRPTHVLASCHSCSLLLDAGSQCAVQVDGQWLLTDAGCLHVCLAGCA